MSAHVTQRSACIARIVRTAHQSRLMSSAFWVWKTDRTNSDLMESDLSTLSSLTHVFEKLRCGLWRVLQLGQDTGDVEQ